MFSPLIKVTSQLLAKTPFNHMKVSKFNQNKFSIKI